MITINERKSGLVKIKKVPAKEAKIVAQAVIQTLMPLKGIIHTITADNGEALQVDFYFPKPYHSWERVANENLNGLVRQYFHKKTDFKTITDKQAQYVEDKL